MYELCELWSGVLHVDELVVSTFESEQPAILLYHFQSRSYPIWAILKRGQRACVWDSRLVAATVATGCCVSTALKASQ